MLSFHNDFEDYTLVGARQCSLVFAIPKAVTTLAKKSITKFLNAVELHHLRKKHSLNQQ